MSNPQLLSEYQEAVAKGDKKLTRRIEDRLVRENQNLVHKLVSKLVKRMTIQWGGDEDDLFQAGCIGMLTAWKRWDPAKGRFSTYAMHWIRHEVQEAISDEQPIYKPRQSGKPWSVYKKQEEIRIRFGREATAEELGVTPERLEEWRASPVVRSLDEAFVVPGAVLSTCGKMRQKVEAIEHDNRVGIHEIVPDPRPNPEATVSAAELHELMLEGLDALTDRESYVIAQIFVEGAPYNFVAQQLGICDSSVWTLRDSALKKLRAAMAAKV